MRFLLTCHLCLLFSVTQAQEVVVTVLPTLNGRPIEPEQTMLVGQDSVTIEKLQFYLSHISVRDAAQSFSFAETARLVVAGSENRLSIPTPAAFIPTEIAFVFGTDSTLNCSGIMGGDLDPTIGMYWAWQSGYINFKLEGISSAFGQKDNSFRLHLGGYRRPFGTARQVTLPVYGTNILVELPLDDLLSEIRKEQEQTIMRPCEKGAELCTFIARNFRIRVE